MDVVFDRGSKERPRGHALLYFRSASDPEEVWVTYLVILPISVDVSKYVPPFLMNQVVEIRPQRSVGVRFPSRSRTPGQLRGPWRKWPPGGTTTYSMPGTANPTDVTAAMMSINEVVQQYAELYSQLGGSPSGGAGAG